MNVPDGLRYTREHEWIRGGEEVATVGITDFAQDELGDIVYVQLPQQGSSIEQFAKLGEIESVKSVSDLYSPVSGEVVETNQALSDKPELVNQDPYGDGWLVKLRLTDADQLSTLLSPDDYRTLTESGHQH